MLPTGIIAPYFGSVAPDGWLLLNGETIGTPSSGATAKASFDTWPLYNLLWANTNVSVVGNRGFDADQDFAANKPLHLPDSKGRTVAGSDPTGGVIPTSSPGDTLGESTCSLQFSELPGHEHTLDYSETVDYGSGGATTTVVKGGTTTGMIVSTTGASGHNNIQPTLIANWIIKL